MTAHQDPGLPLPLRFPVRQWRTLVEAPVFVAAGIAAAGEYRAFRVYREWLRFVHAIRTPDPRFADSALVRDVRAGLHARASSAQPHHPIFELGPDVDAGRVRSNALAACREVAAVLAATPPGEADAFKRWLVAVAEEVAGAATEGAFPSFGRHRVRPEEQAMVRAIAAALGADDRA